MHIIYQTVLCLLFIVSGHVYTNNFGEVFKEQIHIVNGKAKE